MYQLARKKYIQRKSVYSDQSQKEQFTWVTYDKKFETRVDAMRSLFGSEAEENHWSDDMIKRQFTKYARNWKSVKVVKAE
jgi:hypothetical protein